MGAIDISTCHRVYRSHTTGNMNNVVGGCECGAELHGVEAIEAHESIDPSIIQCTGCGRTASKFTIAAHQRVTGHTGHRTLRGGAPATWSAPELRKAAQGMEGKKQAVKAELIVWLLANDPGVFAGAPQR